MVQLHAEHRRFFNANTFGSDYDTVVSVNTRSGGTLTQLACNDDAGDTLQSSVTWRAVAGTTYYIMAGSSFSGPGGNLTLTVQESLPPLEIGLSVDPVGSVNPRTGVVTITGTVTCSQPVDISIDGLISRRLGRQVISGSWLTWVACENGETTWTATTEGDNGKFVAGSAQVSVEAFGCANSFCDLAQEGGQVRLRGRQR